MSKIFLNENGKDNGLTGDEMIIESDGFRGGNGAIIVATPGYLFPDLYGGDFFSVGVCEAGCTFPQTIHIPKSDIPALVDFLLKLEVK